LGTDSILDVTSLSFSTSTIDSLTITVGEGSEMSIDGAVWNDYADLVPLTAASATEATITVSAGANAALDLRAISLTTGALSVASGATLTLEDTIGVTGKAGSYTFSGRGELQFNSSAGTVANSMVVLGTTVTVSTTGLTNESAFTIDASATTVKATITTNAGADVITGGAGNDVISTGLLNDTIVGGAGDDTITSGSGIDSITGGTGADVISASTSGDIVVQASGDSLVATVVSGTTVLTGVDVITATSTASSTIVLNLTGMGNTLADVAVASLVFGSTVMAGVTANEILIMEGIYSSGGIFTVAADGTSTNTHTLIQIDTNGTTAGGIENIVIVGVFNDTASSITTEVLTLVV